MVMRKVLLLVLTFLSSRFIVGCGGDVIALAPGSRSDMIYDDDCDGDIDCVTTQPLIHHWIDSGYIKMWGMVSSAPSKFGAPVLGIFQRYYGHQNLFTIGAFKPLCGQNNSAEWAVSLVNQFNAGDVCTNYPDCGTVLRKSIANYISNGGAPQGLSYVITGELSCEEQLRASSADSISPLTGVQMEKQYIKQFVLMSGAAPDGSETNCRTDAGSCYGFFSTVTSGNGYPPVYVVPVNTGALDVITKFPNSSLPASSPSAFAFKTSGVGETLDEDALAVEFDVVGSQGWKISSDGTNSVDPVSGFNSWSATTRSGQFYLSTSSSPSFFEGVLAVQ
jgi:hypothetical protein